ncbi:hypothetical protein F0562_032484 [Nyssa sinensis]|uniref:NB-ARC domain-containing protein n=1 Tax=Nyssa sinensis TaxID=561372 RepID=A0A5J5ATZ3_9ASTE|nr:hypothetical protein F0562_032484 [Nyssa sinensis]
MIDTTMDFFLENLMLLINCDNELILVEKDQIKSLYEELGFLRNFLKDSERKRYEHERVNNLVAQIRVVSYEAEDIVDWFVLKAVMLMDRSLVEETWGVFAPLKLDDVMEDIKLIKTEVMEIYEKKMYNIGVLQIEKSSHGASSRVKTTIAEQESLVGLDAEASTIMELLIGEYEKQLKVIPIVGMAGLGKTTLVRKVYNDPFIAYHFYIRGWTNVSQVYQKRDLLLSILSSAEIQIRGECNQMNDKELGEVLFRGLKGRKYLIVMDDIWNIGAWEDLKRSFPNDNNGSRIMFTSRQVDVVPLHARPHYMGFLNEDESWDLLQQKAFRKESCPPELMEIGKQIAKKCGGLPLAILVIAGLLAKKDKTQYWWRHVEKSEGFIRVDEHKILEEVAEDYLMDLIDRSLVVVSRRGSNGGIKTCRIHDLLRDLCLRKSQEENFLQHISPYSYLFSNDQRRLSIHPNVIHLLRFESSAPQVRSFFSFSLLSNEFFWRHLQFISEAFKLLRVLSLSSIDITLSFDKIKQLVHLRYLKFFAFGLDLSPPSQLRNLETLIVQGFLVRITLGDEIWKMTKLRHVYTQGVVEIPYVPKRGYPYILNNLQTICGLDLRAGCEEVLTRMTNLRKLKCCLLSNYFPELDFLIHLKTLNVSYKKVTDGRVRFPSPDKFPPNLRQLTLSELFGMPWSETSTFGKLRNLEVLKLLDSDLGPRWDTSDGEFLKLKFLKFQSLDIEQWNTASNHFPKLQYLVLERCHKLKEIPSDIGHISTLEMIKLSWPSPSAANSAIQIQDEQQDLGNDGLKILIYAPKEE